MSSVRRRVGALKNLLNSGTVVALVFGALVGLILLPGTPQPGIAQTDSSEPTTTPPTTAPPTTGSTTSSSTTTTVPWRGGGKPVMPMIVIGCPGGQILHFEIYQNGVFIQQGDLYELGNSGIYFGYIFGPPAAQPGPATMHYTIDCPDPIPDIDMNIEVFYVDPSGIVRTPSGFPVAGATATLYRSDTASGPFVQVPNGSLIMSPGNRDNPDLTDSNGFFAWDVIDGFYKVRAEKAGCVNPSNPSESFVETAVLQVAPPVTDLDLRLQCPAFTGAIVPSSGPAGSTVTILGEGLAGTSYVTLNGAPVNIVSTSNSAVVVRLNSWNTTGRFTLTLPGWVSRTTDGVFTVTPPPGPMIAGFTPSSGPRGSTATISGSGLAAATSVTLNGAPVALVSKNDTTVVVRLNNWSTTGKFTIYLPAGKSVTSASTFTVTP